MTRIFFVATAETTVVSPDEDAVTAANFGVTWVPATNKALVSKPTLTVVMEF